MKKSDDLIVELEEILNVHYTSYKIANNPLLYHEKGPTRITNFIDLQQRIVERASEYKLFGDIELDEGHSFTY